MVAGRRGCHSAEVRARRGRAGATGPICAPERRRRVLHGIAVHHAPLDAERGGRRSPERQTERGRGDFRARVQRGGRPRKPAARGVAHPTASRAPPGALAAESLLPDESPGTRRATIPARNPATIDPNPRSPGGFRACEAPSPVSKECGERPRARPECPGHARSTARVSPTRQRSGRPRVADWRQARSTPAGPRARPRRSTHAVRHHAGRGSRRDGRRP